MISLIPVSQTVLTFFFAAGVNSGFFSAFTHCKGEASATASGRCLAEAEVSRNKRAVQWKVAPIEAAESVLQKGGTDMKLRHRVRVNVCGPGGGKEAVVETARGSFRSRLLRRLVGDRYAVLVLTPVGRRVDSVEVHESRDPGD